jgi:competence protein ComEC
MYSHFQEKKLAAEFADSIPAESYVECGIEKAESGSYGMAGVVSVNGKKSPEILFLYRISKGKIDSVPDLSGNTVIRAVMKKIKWRKPMLPGGFNEKEFYRSKGIALKAELSGISVIKKGENNRDYRKSFRNLIKKGLHKIYGDSGWTFAYAALTGEKRLMEERVKESFSLSGTMHLLAVSGFHIGLIFTMAAKLFGFIPLIRRLKYLLALSFIWSYIYLIGFPPSGVRAGIMLSAASWGIYWGRAIFSWANFWLAFTLSAMVNPSSMETVGFVLSYSALAGILFFLPLIRKHTYKLRNRSLIAAAYFTGLMEISLAAQLGTIIPASYWFGGQNLLSPLINLVAVPVFSILFLLLVFFTILISIINPPPWIFDITVRKLSVFLLSFNGFSGKHAVLFDPWNCYPFGIILIITVFAFYWSYRSWAGRYLLRFILTALAVALIFYPLRHPVKFAQMDVGQGDAALLSDGNNYFLFDAGKPQFGFSQAISGLLKNEKLKQIFITHSDMDHIGGLAYRDYLLPAETLRWPLNSSGKAAESVSLLYSRNGAEIDTVSPGIVYASPFLRIYCLENGRFGELLNWNRNNSSAIYLIETVYFKYLVTGDAEGKEDRILLPWSPFLRGSILKAGHHGSRESSGMSFLRSIEPRLAIISCGKGNRYGHPHRETLARLQSVNCPVWRIDRRGYWSWPVR